MSGSSSSGEATISQLPYATSVENLGILNTEELEEQRLKDLANEEKKRAKKELIVVKAIRQRYTER